MKLAWKKLFFEKKKPPQKQIREIGYITSAHNGQTDGVFRYLILLFLYGVQLYWLNIKSLYRQLTTYLSTYIWNEYIYICGCGQANNFVAGSLFDCIAATVSSSSFFCFLGFLFVFFFLRIYANWELIDLNWWWADDQHVQSVSERRRSAAGRHQSGGGQVRRGGLPLREEDRRADAQHGGYHEPHEEHPDPQRGRLAAPVLLGTSIYSKLLLLLLLLLLWFKYIIIIITII